MLSQTDVSVLMCYTVYFRQLYQWRAAGLKQQIFRLHTAEQIFSPAVHRQSDIPLIRQQSIRLTEYKPAQAPAICFSFTVIPRHLYCLC